MTEKKKIFFPHLDGLRFFCFLSVFLFHSFHTEFDSIKNSGVYTFVKKDLFGNGNIGVNFFFVLSGFLITYLLIEEKESRSTIDVKSFWMRRILRIWPLYYFCVFFGFVIFPWIKVHFGQTPMETADPLYYITFTNNFDFISKGLPDSSVLGVLWSIAIEEQFYLLWPLLLVILPVKHYPKAFILIIAGSLAFRAAFPDPVLYEHHTLSCIGDLTIGALGAYLCRQETFRNRIEHLGRPAIIAVYLAFFIIFFSREQLFWGNYYIRVVERMIIALVILLIILEQNFSKHSFYKMGNFKAVSKLGTISYGLYCLHFIGILITIQLSKMLHMNNNVWEVLLLETSAALLITILISRFSYNYYERFFLKLKEKFAYITK
ncbi:MAG: acyltransferase 3 [Bacteroidetes bacterium]|nr:acyltransferase 3 [Bacteroidota bacterium]